MNKKNTNNSMVKWAKNNKHQEALHVRKHRKDILITKKKLAQLQKYKLTPQ